jgi:transposase-like protein
MSHNKYSPELRAQVIKDFEQTADAKLVAARHSIPEHAVYRIRREQLASPGLSKDKKIRELSQELQKKDLEVRILRELLKKTYQVMPIDSN